MQVLFGAIAAAFVAAIGNAIFTYGNRRADASDSPFGFILGLLLVAAAIIGVIALFGAPKDSGDFLRRNAPGMIIGGVGTAITYVGFFWLYSRYGAGYNTLYGMLALLTTSIGVGIFVFREAFNIWHGVSILCAILALAAFLTGQRIAEEHKTTPSSTQSNLK